MKKDHLEEINKIKDEKNEENSIYLNEIEKTCENFQKNIIHKGMEEIKNKIINLFNKEKDNLTEFIEATKKEIISEIKEEFKKGKLNKDSFNDIKTQIDDINIHIKENINKIKIIQNDITNVKDSVSKLEENQKRPEIEKIKEEYPINYQNNNTINIGKKFINAPPIMKRMPMNSNYMCLNCKNFFNLNECIDIINNKHYNEHSFKLQNNENNDNNIQGNFIEENNIAINNNIINDYIGKENKDDKNKVLYQKEEEIILFILFF